MEKIVAQFFAILMMGIFLNISYRIIKFLKNKIIQKMEKIFYQKTEKILK